MQSEEGIKEYLEKGVKRCLGIFKFPVLFFLLLMREVLHARVGLSCFALI